MRETGCRKEKEYVPHMHISYTFTHSYNIHAILIGLKRRENLLNFYFEDFGFGPEGGISKKCITLI